MTVKYTKTINDMKTIVELDVDMSNEEEVKYLLMLGISSEEISYDFLQRMLNIFFKEEKKG